MYLKFLSALVAILTSQKNFKKNIKNEIYIGTQFDTQEVNSKKAAVTKFV